MAPRRENLVRDEMDPPSCGRVADAHVQAVRGQRRWRMCSCMFSTPGFLPASPRQTRGDAIDANHSRDRRTAPQAMRPALGAARLPIDEGEPLPPTHDRVTSMAPTIDELYRSERPRLLRFLDRRAPDDRAEEIVQQVFTRLVARAQTDAVAIHSPGAYLREAAHNLLRDHARAAA
ncbi:hypothetical protein LTR94_028805, partial [Friedmanniomyces endolithicus]